MNWPWRREKREQSYTDLALAGLVAQAKGTGADPATLAVAGAAARLYYLALGMARIEPASSMASILLTPTLRGMIGSALVLRGNALLALESTEAGLAAIPVTGSADSGTALPESWIYTVGYNGPGTAENRRRRGGDLLHFRWDVDARAPWRGVSPLARAGVDAQALAAINGQLRDAGNAPHGTLLNTGQFEDEDARKAFDANLRKLRGGVATVDRGDVNEPGGGGVTGFGLLYTKVDQGLELTRRDLSDAVASACGVPPALLNAASTGGTGSRESWRQFGVGLHGLGEVLADEIRVKLGEEVTFDFSALASHDIRARASAYKSMTDAGIPGADAARLAGLETGGGGRDD